MWKGYFKFHTYNTFELYILESYKIKKNPIKINDCLEYYNNSKSINIPCRFCRESKIIYSSNIFSSPLTFIFLLDRKNFDKNLINIPFYIEENINLYNLVENKEAPKNYQLTGILSISREKTKYVSFCMSPVDKQWYLYDDETIEVKNLSNILQEHNNNSNNNNKYIPCILVYKAILTQ